MNLQKAAKEKFPCDNTDQGDALCMKCADAEIWKHGGNYVLSELGRPCEYEVFSLSSNPDEPAEKFINVKALSFAKARLVEKEREIERLKAQRSDFANSITIMLDRPLSDVEIDALKNQMNEFWRGVANG